MKAHTETSSIQCHVNKQNKHTRNVKCLGCMSFQSFGFIMLSKDIALKKNNKIKIIKMLNNKIFNSYNAEKFSELFTICIFEFSLSPEQFPSTMSRSLSVVLLNSI